ncbi:MAG TPA: aldehyde dehydrogenase family protein, partial [Rhodospirillales bacterium]
MAGKLRTISPVNGRVYVERPYAADHDVAVALHQARRAQEVWRAVLPAERAEVVSRAVDAVVAAKQPIAEEITWQMGRPIRYSPGEVGGFEERARHMIAIAADTLKDVAVGAKPGFNRFIRRQPLGVVFVIAPWNYPWLTSVNSLVPALMAGNSVILKHSAQTPLVAERYAEAFETAGLPTGVFQFLHLDHSQTERVIKAPEVNFVAFTGSVAGGRMVEGAAQG